MATQKERRAAPRKLDRNIEAKFTPKAASAANPTAAKPPAGRPSASETVSNEALYKQIAETAYFKAKARGFAPGGEVQDWIEAEAEVRQRRLAS
jgi:hypothetical protein